MLWVAEDIEICLLVSLNLCVAGRFLGPQASGGVIAHTFLRVLPLGAHSLLVILVHAQLCLRTGRLVVQIGRAERANVQAGAGGHTRISLLLQAVELFEYSSAQRRPGRHVIGAKTGTPVPLEDCRSGDGRCVSGPQLLWFSHERLAELKVHFALILRSLCLPIAAPRSVSVLHDRVRLLGCVQQ